MKAVVIREHGGLDNLRLEDVPVPRPGPGAALVRVRAVGLNNLDIWARSGPPGGRPIYPWRERQVPTTTGVDAVIHAVLPLSDAREAHRCFEAREHFGKIVLVP